MPLTPSEKRKNRLKNNKQYNVYIPLKIAIPFDELLKKENIKFTEWLKYKMKNESIKNLSSELRKGE